MQQELKATSSQPGRWRSFFWPIYGQEHKKLIPMFLLFFLITFIYNLLRSMKVTLIVTAEGSGAEVIPFLKTWAVLPGAVLMTFLYTWLANRFTRSQVFYLMLALFLGFFTFFLSVLYPHRALLELTSLTSFLSERLPPCLKGLHGLLVILKYWHLSLFYVLSDLWSSVVLSMLFWGFSNEITSVSEAKRFYAIFALGSNSSGIFSGQFAQALSFKHGENLHLFGRTGWDGVLMTQLISVLALGLVIVLLFYWINRSFQLDEKDQKSSQGHREEAIASAKAQKPMLSLKECFTYLFRSRYLLYLVVIVVAYNIVYNLSDVLWTHQVHQRYPAAADFNHYINKIASVTGVFATISALFLSGNVIRAYGWTATALITPAIWLLTGIGFFGSLLVVGHASTLADWLYAFFHLPLTQIALLFGSAQICLGRAAKYTVFDESKEIAFIPLSKDEQRKAKAVVDGLSSRLGKSGGSLMIQGLLLLSGGLVSALPYIAAISLVMICGWIWAVLGLGKQIRPHMEVVSA